jgi:hypothetical protein
MPIPHPRYSVVQGPVAYRFPELTRNADSKAPSSCMETELAF